MSLISELKHESKIIRASILEALYASGGGHYGGALSIVDILVVLYRCILNRSIHPARKYDRDHLILSKGHAAIALYAVLKHIGILNKFDLAGYGKCQTGLEGHPDMTQTPGIDFSTGSLGQGLGIGLGMAVALRNKNRSVWVILGDGECEEGQVWEAAMLAARLKITNLFAVIDINGAQEFGWTYDKSVDQEPCPNLKKKWNAFGWDTIEVDGHNHDDIRKKFTSKHTERPSVFLARTRKGKSVRTIEEQIKRFHCTSVTKEEYDEIKKQLLCSHD